MVKFNEKRNVISEEICGAQYLGFIIRTKVFIKHRHDKYPLLHLETMKKKYSYWIMFILMVYTSAVIYIMSSLKADGNGGREWRETRVYNQNPRAKKTLKHSPLSRGRKNINVIVESFDEEDFDKETPRPEARGNTKRDGLHVAIKEHREPTLSRIRDSDLKSSAPSLQLVNVSFTPPINEFQIYSVYFDDRLSESYIRFIAIGPRNKQKSRSSLWCVFNNQRLRSNSTLATEVRFSKSSESHQQQKLVFYLLVCLVPKIAVKEFKKKAISRVYLSLSKTAKKGRSVLVVNNKPFRPENRTLFQFLVCVTPSHGDIKPLHLVEFIEFSRILGAEHFVFYRHSISDELDNILRFYYRLGLVTVLPWDISIASNSRNSGEMTAVADCLYRTMFKSKRVAFNDVGEFVVPRQVKSWKTMMVYLEKQSLRLAKKVSAYRFKSSVFHGNSEALSSERRLFLTLNNTMREATLSDVKTGLMVYPEAVIEIGSNKFLRSINHEHETVNVDSEMAILHKYCHGNDVGITTSTSTHDDNVNDQSHNNRKSSEVKNIRHNKNNSTDPSHVNRHRSDVNNKRRPGDVTNVNCSVDVESYPCDVAYKRCKLFVEDYTMQRHADILIDNTKKVLRRVRQGA